MSKIEISNLLSQEIQDLTDEEKQLVKGGTSETTVQVQQFDDGSMLVTSTTITDGWRGTTSTWSYDIDGNKGPVYTSDFLIA